MHESGSAGSGLEKRVYVLPAAFPAGDPGGRGAGEYACRAIHKGIPGLARHVHARRKGAVNVREELNRGMPLEQAHEKYVI